MDELILHLIHCNKLDLIHIQCKIEQLYQLYSQEIHPSPIRRCLAPINTNKKTNTSPRVK